MHVELMDKDDAVVLERKINNLPAEEPPPPIIMWGSRLFVHTSTTDRYPTMDNEVIQLYREAWMYHIPV